MYSHSVKSIRDKFKRSGVFYTPESLSFFIRSLVDFEPREVYDPTCGNGSLLSAFDDRTEKYGQEIDSSQLDVAAGRLKNFTGFAGDTLANDGFKGRKFHCIVSNYPFSIKWDPWVDDCRMHGFSCVPTQGRADFAFIMHIMNHMTSDGIAVIMGFPGILYRGGRERNIRADIIKCGHLSTVISVPGGTFEDTSISTCILIIDNREKFNSVKFIEVNDSLDIGSSASKVVGVSDIVNNDFNLSVSSYIIKDEVKQEIDETELNNSARQGMIRKIMADIECDIMVCEIEGFDKFNYIDMIIRKLNDKRDEMSRQ